jgi:tRNA(Ile)-lysidine synthase
MIVSTFRKTLASHRMAVRGDKVLLAVSGGADSVCLLRLFLEIRKEAGLRVAVAHYNHRLRGRESEEDASFVRDLASRSSLPFHLGTAPEGGTTSSAGESLQVAAREARLSFLLATARKFRCRRIALGHTADDQAETMVMRFLCRGGPAGLGGIPPVSHRRKVIHPLLGIRRHEIESWLFGAAVRYRQDRSNSSTLYLRNKLRRELLPALIEDYNPRLVERLAEMAELLRRDNDCLEEAARVLLLEGRHEGRTIFLPAGLLSRSHPALLARTFLAALRTLSPKEKGFDRRHVEALLEGLGKPRFLRWDLPGDITASLDRRGLTFAAGVSLSSGQTPFHYPLSVPGRVEMAHPPRRIGATVRRRVSSFDPRILPGIPWRAVLDWEKVSPPLEVRSRRAGDRYHPLGRGGGRKLKEMFIAAKVPRPERDFRPLVCDSRGIIWVPGFPPSHRCRITPSTKKILYLRARPPAAGK